MSAAGGYRIRLPKIRREVSVYLSSPRPLCLLTKQVIRMELASHLDDFLCLYRIHN